jgi:PKD repeat protein
MKKFFILLSIIFCSVVTFAQVNAPCCPDFKIEALSTSGKECCMSCNNPIDTLNTNGGMPPVQGGACRDNPLAVCKNSWGQFIVYPNLAPGYTYQWTITGGTPTNITGNPVAINWGSGPTGSITVTITGNGCNKTITRKVCFLDKPQAQFTYSPNINICTGTNITFNNQTLGGTVFTWLFGDGTSSQDVNPQHIYGTAGTYVVTLIASNNSGGGNAVGGSCGCVDTIKKTIVVGNGPGIETCNKMLCPGDTATYCSTTTCSSYAWSITGGTIIGSNTTQCIKVVWTTPLGSLTLNTTGCGACNTNTIIPNVIWPVLPYTGPVTVCVGSTNTYTVPTIPGTFYSWSISGAGATILNGGGAYPNNYPVNNPSVNVNFTTPGTYTLTCNYHNPNTKKDCGGTTTITINVLPKFAITGLTSICQNTVGTYTTADFSSASWAVTGTPGGFSPAVYANGSSINVNWLLPGTYTLTATSLNPSAYCNPSVTTTITVKPSPVLSFTSPQTVVCANSLTNYTITSNVTGNVTWLFTSGTGTINPFGTDNMSASVSFTGTGPWTLQASQTKNGCTGTTSVNVTKVPPPPGITLSPGASTCSGGVITASVTGVVPIGGYTWSCSPGAVLTGGQGTTSATFVVNSNATITITSCGGMATIPVTVTAASVSITKVNGPCNATLTASPGGGTYQWFLNGNPYGTGNPIVVTQNGNYTVLATYSGGCTANSTIVVTGITPVTTSISATGSLCNGGSVTIVATVSANCTGGVFNWSNGAVGNPITVTTPGSYSVTVTCANGCTATSNVIVVSPCVPPPGNCIPDLVISGNNNCNNPVTLTASAPGCTPVSAAWSYGDGFGGTTGNHLYANPGIYTVIANLTCADGTVHCGSQIITVPMVDSFTSVISCAPGGWSVQLQDASMFIPSYAGYTLTWSTTCGSLSATNIPNPILTVPIGCNPTVTLTISKNGCTLTKPFTFSFPNTPFIINGNTSPCKNADNVYSSSYTTGVIAYAWNFGDATSGVTNPITHHFNGTPTNPTITLTITDRWGCQFTATKPITVIIPPLLTITPSPLIKICPNCLPAATPLTATAGFTNYQWYQNGVAIAGPAGTSQIYQLCNFNASGNYYVTAQSTPNNCLVISDTVKVVYEQTPDARISPRGIQCVGAFPASISGTIQSGIGFNANYTYSWYLNNTGGTPIYTSNLVNTLTYTVPSAACYVFIVKVKDNVTGCIAYDTACICFSKSPTVNITPSGSFCAGTPQTFTANVTPAGTYTYVWQDGTLSQTYTTSLAGNYTVTVADVYGCSNSASTSIKPLPYVNLFPQGCDTLCDTAHLYFPLPQTTGGFPPYTITWYEGVTVIGTGYSIPIIGLGLGLHNIHAVVQMGSCSATTNMLNLFIKHCTGCDCKESHWGDIILTEGENQGLKSANAQGDPVPAVAVKRGIEGKKAGDNPGNKEGQKLECKNSYELKCNQTYSINAFYNCKDTACPPKVTYVLQPPTGAPITGTAPATFTPTQSGVYTLTLYGWCGGKICDSCIIDFKVTCIECDCKGSKWGEKTITINNQTKDFKCQSKDDKPIDVKCRVPITINANYICAKADCNGTVSYSLTTPSGTTTGNVPLTFTPNQSGIYTLVLYGMCGGKICDSCIVRFKTECDSVPCCPYEIKVEPKTPTYVVNPTSTTVSNSFGITIPASANITEVRANVISYTIDDNFKGDCMKCVNLPFTWASTSTATNIATAPPKITMFGGATVPSFNGSGTGVYQNPREVVWNNGTNLNSPNITNIGMSFILPPTPNIDCCELKGKICVKFTFRNDKCEECEAIGCFNFVVKKK